jgi:hypothetical protein
LEKYDKQTSLDPAGWLLQLGLRRDLMTKIKAQISDSSQTADEDGIHAEIIEWIHHDPILEWDKLLANFGPLVQMMFPSLAPLHSLHPRNDMGVHPATVEESYRSQVSLDPDLRSHVTKFYEQMRKGIEEDDKSPAYFEELDIRVKMRRTGIDSLLEESHSTEEKVPYHPMMSHPLYCSSEHASQNFLFTVNVALPDKLLEAQFLDAVRRVRQYFSTALDVSTRLAINPAEVWIDEQLLAYFDLSIEKHLAHGVPLSRPEIADLIWPSDGSGKGSLKNWDSRHITDTTDSLLTGDDG